MKLIRIALRSEKVGFYFRQINRSFSALPNPIDSFSGSGNNDNQNAKYSESTDDFSERIFGGISEDTSNSFYRSLDRIEKGRFGPGMGSPGSASGSGLGGAGSGFGGAGSGFGGAGAGFGGAGSSSMFGEDDDTFSSLNDGMEGKLKKQATYFEVDQQEIAADDYSYREDMNLRPRMNYTPEDLDIRKPGVWKPGKRLEFQVTTKEVLENADFRNVRFLANFLSEAGIIIKRNKTGISAKAQRKVAREIKIARSFGLLPFTTMGTKAFVFGKTMESLEQDYEFDPYDVQADDDVPDPVAD